MNQISVFSTGRKRSASWCMTTAVAAIAFFGCIMAMAAAVAEAHGTIAMNSSEGLFVLEGPSENRQIFSESVQSFGVSPNGEEVVYVPAEGSNRNKVVLQNLYSEHSEVIAEGADSLQNVSFGPREEIIGTGGDGIYAMNLKGEDVRRLVAVPGNAPVVSTSGYLAYLTNGNLWVEPPTVGGIRHEPFEMVSRESYPGLIYQPAFNPAGTEILYSTSQGSYSYDLVTHELTRSYPGFRGQVEWSEESRFIEAESPSVKELWQYSPEEVVHAFVIGHLTQMVGIAIQPTYGSVEPPLALMPPGEQLLSEFTPVLEFDSEEPYFPIPPERVTQVVGLNEGKFEYANYLKREGEILADPLYEFPEWAEEEEHVPSGYFQFGLADMGSEYPVDVPPEWSRDALASDNIDEHDNTHLVDEASIYRQGEDTVVGHVVSEPDGDIWLEYWLYYYYNNGQYGVDDHESDWEEVAVHLSSAAGYLQDDMVLSEHDFASQCHAGEYQVDDEIQGPLGGVPVVYVANGSHANYPEEGEWETDVVGFNDFVYPDPEVVPAVQPRVEDVDEHINSYEEVVPAAPWLSWPGKWGGSGASPQGPAVGEHEEQWHEPGIWAYGAEGCTSDRPFVSRTQSHAVQRGGQGVSPAPLTIKSAQFVKGGIQVRYTISKAAFEEGEVRMMLSADSANDLRAPVTIIKARPGRSGSVKLPVHGVQDRSGWLVSGSLHTEQGREQAASQEVALK
jgi:hypothetical protein